MDVGPGDFVECVRGGASAYGTGAYLVEGRIYTVRRVGLAIGIDGIARAAIFVTAPEASIPGEAWAEDHGWGVTRFRPIRKPPIPAEILALQTPTPADAESVREAEGV